MPIDRRSEQSSGIGTLNTALIMLSVDLEMLLKFTLEMATFRRCNIICCRDDVSCCLLATMRTPIGAQCRYSSNLATSDSRLLEHQLLVGAPHLSR